jgi:hypothetical protein
MGSVRDFRPGMQGVMPLAAKHRGTSRRRGLDLPAAMGSGKLSSKAAAPIWSRTWPAVMNRLIGHPDTKGRGRA